MENGGGAGLRRGSQAACQAEFWITEPLLKSRSSQTVTATGVILKRTAILTSAVIE